MKLFALLLFVAVSVTAICTVILEAFDKYCCMAVRRAKHERLH